MSEYMVVIHTDREPEAIKAECTLEKLQELVDGYIEIVNVKVKGNRLLMVIDEEGKLKDKPENDRATMLYRALFDVIVGEAVIVAQDGEDLRGLTVSETDDVMEYFDPLHVGKWFHV